MPTMEPVQPDQAGLKRVRRARNWRRSGLAAGLVFLLAGSVGAFGVRSTTISASTGDYEMTVTYPAMARPGLAAPWSVEVRRAGGFDGPIQIATTADYFSLFDENGLDPNPASSNTRGDALLWTFDPPDGPVLLVDYDARIEPGVHRGMEATTSLIENDVPVVTVTYVTRIAP